MVGRAPTPSDAKSPLRSNGQARGSLESRVAKRPWVPRWRRLVQLVSSPSRGLAGSGCGSSVQSTRLLERSLLDHGTLVENGDDFVWAASARAKFVDAGPYLTAVLVCTLLTSLTDLRAFWTQVPTFGALSPDHERLQIPRHLYGVSLQFVTTRWCTTWLRGVRVARQERGTCRSPSHVAQFVHAKPTLRRASNAGLSLFDLPRFLLVDFLVGLGRREGIDERLCSL